MANSENSEIVSGLIFVVLLLVGVIALIVLVIKLQKRSPLGQLATRRGWKYDGSRFSAERDGCFSWYGGAEEDSDSGHVDMVFRGHIAHVPSLRVVVLQLPAYEAMLSGRARQAEAQTGSTGLQRAAQAAVIGAAVALSDGQGLHVSARESGDWLADASLKRFSGTGATFDAAFVVSTNAPETARHMLSQEAAAQLLNWAALPACTALQLHVIDGVLTLRLTGVRLTAVEALERFIAVGEQWVHAVSLQQAASG